MNIHEFMDIHGLSENHKKSQWTSMDLPCIALIQNYNFCYYRVL
jgi:hypothetical protein